MKKQELTEALQLLVDKGFTLCEVDTGGNDIPVDTVEEGVDAIMLEDMTTLFLNKNDRNYWIDFFRDSPPGESMGDCSVNDSIDDVVDFIHEKYSL